MNQAQALEMAMDQAQDLERNIAMEMEMAMDMDMVFMVVALEMVPGKMLLSKMNQ